MENPILVSGPHSMICPLCEESRLAFSGLYSARCPACDYEPDGVFLETLHQIVALPDAPETLQGRAEQGPQTRKPGIEKESEGRTGAGPED